MFVQGNLIYAHFGVGNWLAEAVANLSVHNAVNYVH